MISWMIALAVLPSLLVSLLAAYIVRRLAPRCALVDRPNHRKVHAHPIPLGGGIAIWLGVVVTFAVAQFVLHSIHEPISADALPPRGAQLYEQIAPHLSGMKQQAPKLWFLLGASTILMVVGLIDDRRGLPWQLRLSVQFLVAAIVVASGWRLTLFIALPWLTFALSVLWIVTLINSFNMLDNMDGQSAGVAAIASSMLAAVLLLSYDPQTQQPQLFVAAFLLVLVGSLLGFLWHNRPPARIFMGDAGSYFIGFYVAVATIMATFTGGDLPRHSILAPLCVLAVPLYDTATVVLIRLKHGKSPFEADKNHFAHRLVELGMTKPQAVATIYLLTATCGLGALLLHQVDAVGAAVILLLVGCVLTIVGVLELAARRAQRHRDADPN